MKKWFTRFLLIVMTIMSMVGMTSSIAFADNTGLTVHFVDVGQADAAIIQCDDKVMMIDGGNSADSDLIFSYLKKTLGIKHIDYMVSTHPHEDHVGGLVGALNACTVGTLYSPVQDYDSKAFSAIKKYAGKQKLTLEMPPMDQPIPLGSGSFEFFSPRKHYEETNDQSLVLKLTYGETSFLFTGDAEWDPEHDMIDAGVDLKSTVLKVGHHGSDSSTSYVFLREIMPQYAVISVGKDNSYGHPTDAVLSRLRDADVTVYRTDLNGTVICESDGKTVKFTTSKNETAKPNTAKKETIEDESESGGITYLLNTNTKKFHYPDCRSVNQMKAKNKKEVTSSREEIIKKGYKPCGNCDP